MGVIHPLKWKQVKYRTTYDVTNKVYLENCRSIDDIKQCQDEHTPFLNQAKGDLQLPSGPTFTITTLWYVPEPLEEQEKRARIVETKNEADIRDNSTFWTGMGRIQDKGHDSVTDKALDKRWIK